MKTEREYCGTEKTVWEIVENDVWGNAKDGYEVNNAYRCGTIEFNCPKYKYGVGTKYEHISAQLTNSQIKKALKIKPRFRLQIDGDDLTYYVAVGKDNYPVGSLRCISHESLSPITRKV